MTQKTTTYLASAVRYFANPSLRGNAEETPEMEQRTIGVLSGLQARLPLVVLRLDEQNHYDSQAVVVLEHGRLIAYLAADDAHQCVAEYGERLRVGIPVRVTEVSVEKHGVFWVEKPKMKGGFFCWGFFFCCFFFCCFFFCCFFCFFFCFSFSSCCS